MKQQNDWYTGIEYYHNEPSAEVDVSCITIDECTHSAFHEHPEIFYFFSGKAEMEINGCTYPVSEGSFVCLYAHHFYRFNQVEKPMKALKISFHIGLFMYMSWEKHPQNAHAALVYDTCPVVHLKKNEKKQVMRLAEEILEESTGRRFESFNLVVYKTLELHAYHCRHAFESIGLYEGKGENPVWKVIVRSMLAYNVSFTLEEMAAECGMGCAELNRKIKEACGYTFHQLRRIAKMTNACALLHFPELDIDYISDLLEFSSKQDFYRVFLQYCHRTPKEYQSQILGGAKVGMWAASTALCFLQYMHVHFHEDITMDSLCEQFCLKQYTVKDVFKRAFGMSFAELLGQIRVSYACAFLRITPQTILHISNLCGFESLSTFQRVFFQWMGQTPGEYRKLNVKN